MNNSSRFYVSNQLKKELKSIQEEWEMGLLTRQERASKEASAKIFWKFKFNNLTK